MQGMRRRLGVIAWAAMIVTALGSMGCLGWGPRQNPPYASGCTDPNCPSCQANRQQYSGCPRCQVGGHGVQGDIQQVGYQPQGHPEGNIIMHGGPGQQGPGPLPRELMMSSHPPYTVAAPDILFIDTLRMVPRPPYRLEALEVLIINVAATLPNQPINGPYSISPDGLVNLGYNYGSVMVAGMTMEGARDAIALKLLETIRDPASPKDRPRPPQVNIALAQFRGMQNVKGEHLVRTDGTISLGTYGSLYVAGMTLGQVKFKVEEHLSQYLVNPQVAVDVFAYNSKKYYVIVDGAGFGQLVFSFPVTGNEHVLDAITNVNGLAPVSSKNRIWLARPSPVNMGCNQILPVDWNAITQGGSTRTNYQLFPGDRIYVAGDCLTTFDNYLSKLLAPVERVLGIGLLGSSIYNSLNNNNNGSNNGVVVVR